MSVPDVLPRGTPSCPLAWGQEPAVGESYVPMPTNYEIKIVSRVYHSR